MSPRASADGLTHTARVPGAVSVIARTACGRDRMRAELAPHGQATCPDCYPRTVVEDADALGLPLAPGYERGGA